MTLAREVAGRYRPSDGLVPHQHLPARRTAARDRYRDVFERRGIDPDDRIVARIG